MSNARSEKEKKSGKKGGNTLWKQAATSGEKCTPSNFGGKKSRRAPGKRMKREGKGIGAREGKTLPLKTAAQRGTPTLGGGRRGVASGSRRFDKVEIKRERRAGAGGGPGFNVRSFGGG